MFREMRRKDRLLPEKEAMDILSQNPYGVLSLMGHDGYPYGVPMHYALEGDTLYFHCSKAGGLKTECLDQNPKVCFTVVEPICGVKCRSAVAFGTMEKVPALREDVLNRLIEKFVPPEGAAQAKAGVPLSKDGILAYRLAIKHISAKVIDKPDGR